VSTAQNARRRTQAVLESTPEYPAEYSRVTRAVQADVRWVWSGALGDKSVKVLTDRVPTGVLTGVPTGGYSPAYSLECLRWYSRGYSPAYSLECLRWYSRGYCG
jgi:hypothetical protein